MNEADFLRDELAAMQNAYELSLMITDSNAQRFFELPMRRFSEVAERMEERLNALHPQP